MNGSYADRARELSVIRVGTEHEAADVHALAEIICRDDNHNIDADDVAMMELCLRRTLRQKPDATATDVYRTSSLLDHMLGLHLREAFGVLSPRHAIASGPAVERVPPNQGN